MSNIVQIKKINSCEIIKNNYFFQKENFSRNLT